MDDAAPLFSVVIPTRHRDGPLARCLDCLAPGRQNFPKQQYEVIVTDDGSMSTARALLSEAYPWARWVAGPQRGPAANRNNGARQAAGEWLVFTDDDCLPDPGWLAAYRNRIEKGTSQLLEGRTYADRPRRSLAEAAPINDRGGNLWSCNFAIARSLFEAVGGFDERFPYAAMEDSDLRLRLEQAGHRPLFVPEAAVCHPWRTVRGWQSGEQHRHSILIYLSLHPEETARINARYYLYATTRNFWRFTLPGLFAHRGAGFTQALIDHAACLKMAWTLRKLSTPKIPADHHVL
ncbi:glycosyltransferase family 2 protein [Gloeobacter kilaueensis]|uniref:Glycosyl transferase family 2 n=1 Tax=Gloeobacter kilaueensis (strain ATCC BAA-2537 / CCAP 1431/1 / ULC 316 / JS1) TaxID=1183438 RepID=U5QQ11_GLOK1|nr:glycosyltransferase [Gloeobacter kilaueensis]AGY59719.1 glycosyl transferase family 2 [Gloeobacter kilaueensis JS1]